MKIRLIFFQTFSIFSLCALNFSVQAAETESFSVYLGYLTQVHCTGRLYVSSVGNPNLIQWEAFPKELGCGVVLKPKGLLGATDLLLKTSTGDYHFLVEVKN